MSKEEGVLTFKDMAKMMLTWGQAYTYDGSDYKEYENKRDEILKKTVEGLTSDGIVLLGILKELKSLGDIHWRIYTDEKIKTIWIRSREIKHGHAPEEVLVWIDQQILNGGKAFSYYDIPNRGGSVRKIYDNWMRKRQPKKTKEKPRSGA